MFAVICKLNVLFKVSLMPLIFSFLIRSGSDYYYYYYYYYYYISNNYY